MHYNGEGQGPEQLKDQGLSLDLTMEKEVEEAAREMMSLVEGERREACNTWDCKM